jgi:hypothetical protein
MATRNRRPAKAAATSSVHVVELEGRWVVFISWLISQIQGLGKENSRVVGNILDVMGFEDQDFRVEPKEKYEFELSGYEIQFLVDQIESEWKSEKVPPIHSGNSHKMYSYLKEVLESPPLVVKESE